MKSKSFLLVALLIMGLWLVGCSEGSENNKVISTALGEGEYQTFLNANGEPLKDDKPFLFIESSKEVMTEENIVKFYDETISKAKSEDFTYGIVKFGEYGLSFIPDHNAFEYGKIKPDCSPLLANSRLESVEKYLVIENGKIKVEE